MDFQRPSWVFQYFSLILRRLFNVVQGFSEVFHGCNKENSLRSFQVSRAG